MQEIAEASVESILTGIDSPDDPLPSPETPPTRDPRSEWFSPSGGSTPFSSKPSWSFSEAESNSSSQQPFNRREVSNSIYTPSDQGSANDEHGAMAPPDACTTVMLRNIPNKYTRSGLLAALVERGFDPSSDCNNLYLPMDASSGCNLGYAFLNFTTHEKALSFMKQFDGCRLPSAGSRKVCSVVWANKQGLFQHSNPPTSKEQTVPGAFNPLVSEGIPTCKIFVGGLPVTTTEADLVEYFSSYGLVREASIVINRQTGASRGFGFCEFTAPEAVELVQLAQSGKPHSINCRVVSVRPYNSTSQVPTDYGSQPIEQPATMTFLMGNGMIHCPTGSPALPIGYSGFGNATGAYSHPLLAPPSVAGISAPGYPSPLVHSFMSY